jgi:hypothetical protein
MLRWLQWASVFNTFVNDKESRQDFTKIRDEIEAYLAIHEGFHSNVTADDHVLHHMYELVWEDICLVSTPSARARYIVSMKQYLRIIIIQNYFDQLPNLGFELPAIHVYLTTWTHPVQALRWLILRYCISNNLWIHSIIRKADYAAHHIVKLCNNLLALRRKKIAVDESMRWGLACKDSIRDALNKPLVSTLTVPNGDMALLAFQQVAEALNLLLKSNEPLDKDVLRWR